jgi:predicted ester cyclase
MVMTIKDSVRKLFIDVFQDGKLEVADEILTEDFKFQYPFPGFSPGIEGIKEFTKVFHTGFPGFEVKINDLFEGESNEVISAAIRWTLRGTHKGNFLGLKETGKYVTISAIGIYYPGKPGGPSPKLARGWLEMDTMGQLQQVGAVEPTHKLLPALRTKNDINP